MLAKRIIPTILCRGKTAYKGERFVSTRSIGSALGIAQVHARRGVDELCILDIGATAEGRGPDLDLIRELSAGCYIPITVGGGVKTLQDIDNLLRAGADKVAICSAAPDEGFMSAASERFGRQAIVGVIDHRKGMVVVRNGEMALISETFPRGLMAVPYAKLLEEVGAGELIVQSVDRDGAMEGYDLEPVFDVAAAVSIPVIVSGGCSGYADMEAAFKAGADACAAGALFQFTDATPRQAAQYLKGRGVEVRA